MREPVKRATSQYNMKLGANTIQRLKAAAAVERRSVGDQADIFLEAALDEWEAQQKAKAAKAAKT